MLECGREPSVGLGGSEVSFQELVLFPLRVLGIEPWWAILIALLVFLLITLLDLQGLVCYLVLPDLRQGFSYIIVVLWTVSLLSPIRLSLIKVLVCWSHRLCSYR